VFLEPCNDCYIGQATLLNDDVVACALYKNNVGGIGLFDANTGEHMAFLEDEGFRGVSSLSEGTAPVPGADGSIISPFGWTVFVPACNPAHVATNREQCSFAGTCVNSQCVCAEVRSWCCRVMQDVGSSFSKRGACMCMCAC